MLCDDLKGWNGGMGEWEEIFVYIQLIHNVEQQKLT